MSKIKIEPIELPSVWKIAIMNWTKANYDLDNPDDFIELICNPPDELRGLLDSYHNKEDKELFFRYTSKLIYWTMMQFMTKYKIEHSELTKLELWNKKKDFYDYANLLVDIDIMHQNHIPAKGKRKKTAIYVVPWFNPETHRRKIEILANKYDGFIDEFNGHYYHHKESKPEPTVSLEEKIKSKIIKKAAEEKIKRDLVGTTNPYWVCNCEKTTHNFRTEQCFGCGMYRPTKEIEA